MNKLPEIRETFSETQIAEIQATVGQGLSKTELTLFLHQCAALELNPLAKDIYAIKTRQGLQIQISISGYRKIAQRTGEYLGQTPPEWCGKDGKWVDVWLGQGNPLAAKVGIIKKGLKEPIYGVVTWASFGGDGHMWKKMPDHMLAKSAESQALRKAFPEQFGSTISDTEHLYEDKDTDVSSINAEFEDEQDIKAAREQVKLIKEGEPTIPIEEVKRGIASEPGPSPLEQKEADEGFHKMLDKEDLGAFIIEHPCGFTGKAIKDIPIEQARAYCKVNASTKKAETLMVIKKMKAYFG